MTAEQREAVGEYIRLRGKLRKQIDAEVKSDVVCEMARASLAKGKTPRLDITGLLDWLIENWDSILAMIQQLIDLFNSFADGPAVQAIHTVPTVVAIPVQPARVERPVFRLLRRIAA